jgi:hypothetical protein
MQNHVAELTRCLDRLGVGQLVVTSRRAGPADRDRFGAHGQVIRVGLRIPILRQGWAPPANTPMLTIQGRLRQVHACFRQRSPAQLLATATPDSSPWLPDRYRYSLGEAA